MVAVQRTHWPAVNSPAQSTSVGAVLCAITIAAATWAVLAAGWVDGAGGALVVAVAAVAEASVLAYARVPRGVAVALVPVLALAVIIPATISAMPVDGDPSAGHLIGRYLGAVMSGLSSTSDWQFTVGLCGVLWLCGYWMAWLALREHRGVLAVLPVYIVLATNVLNAKSASNVALPEALAIAASLLVIANAHLDGLQRRWASQRISSLPGIRSRMVLSAAVLGAGVVILGLLIPPATTTDISGRFFAGAGGSGGAGRAVAITPNSPATIAFNGNTEPGGPLVSQPHPVLTYAVDTDAPVYLSLINDTVFSEGNWYPEHSGTQYSDGYAYEGVSFAAGALPRDHLRVDGAVPIVARVVNAEVTLQPHATGGVDQAPFAGEPVSSSEAGIAFGSVDQSVGSALFTVDAVQLDAGIGPNTTIDTSAWINTATADQLRAAGTRYPPFTSRYTPLPDDFTHGAATITALAQQWSAGTSNPYDAATAIESHLRDPRTFTYTLTPPIPPTNEWPVVYFLTSSHHGYCQYFASAMGAMMRSLGIPTRLVNGYGPGTTLAIGNRHGQREHQVTTSDAHTWVEAYFPTYGWVPFEPTPPSNDGNYVPFGRGAAAVTTGPTTPPPPAVSRPGFSVDPTQNTPAPPTPAPKHAVWAPSPLLVLMIIAGVIVAGALGTLLWLLAPRSLRGTWRRLEVVGLALGLRKRASETHRAYAARLAAAVARGSRAGVRPSARSRAATAITDIATMSAQTEFARPATRGFGSPRVRREWGSVLRLLPMLTWRAIARREGA